VGASRNCAEKRLYQSEGDWQSGNGWEKITRCLETSPLFQSTQIRSHVLHIAWLYVTASESRWKRVRRFDGDIDPFVEAYLLQVNENYSKSKTADDRFGGECGTVTSNCF
jgi:hypothetical protein